MAEHFLERSRSGWIIQNSVLTLEADSPRTDQGSIRAVLTVRVGDIILYRNLSNLTSEHARKKVVKSLADKGYDLDESLIIALDDASRIRTPAEHSGIVAADVPHNHEQVEPGYVILDDVCAFLGRFVAYPSEAAQLAHALWVGHAHLMDVWVSTPRLAFLSPEPASGKTRALEVTELLVPRPVEAVNVTPAYLFRKVADPEGRPTILFDEIDTIFGPKASNHEELRGLLNAGHRAGAVAGRCVVRGESIETEEIPAYCAVALAGLGDLPDTILTRCVTVKMRRRKPGERVDPFRRRVEESAGHALRERLEAWARSVKVEAAEAWPSLPPSVTDRDADVWEPLLAVADAAGGEWPERARVAAVALVAASKESTPSIGIRLLTELRTVFGDQDVMSTERVIEALCSLDESPWAEIAGGKPLNPRGLSQRLAKYGVGSKNVRIGDRIVKGYSRADLVDVWSRYVPVPCSPQQGATSATDATPATTSLPICAGCSEAFESIDLSDSYCDSCSEARQLLLVGGA